MFYVYILRSEKDVKLYTGHTSDIGKRLFRHNSGLVKSTKHRRLFKLIYYELYSTRSEAMRREKYLKSPEGGSKKGELINKFLVEKLKDFRSVAQSG